MLINAAVMYYFSEYENFNYKPTWTYSLSYRYFNASSAGTTIMRCE